MKMEIDGELLHDTIKAAEGTGNEDGLMRLKNGKWVMKTVGQDTVLMYATRIGEDAMESFQPGELAKIGINFESVKNSIINKNKTVTLERVDKAGHQLLVSQDGFEATLNLINPEYIEGDLQDAPDFPYPVKVKGDLSFINDFISQQRKIVGGSAMFFGADDNGLYLYSEEDNQALTVHKEWDEFEEYQLNWDVGQQAKPGYNNPPEDHACETIVSVGHAKEMSFISDKGWLFLQNHMPLKILFDAPDGVDASYFLSPRIPGNDSRMVIPEEEKR